MSESVFPQEAIEPVARALYALDLAQDKVTYEATTSRREQWEPWEFALADYEDAANAALGAAYPFIREHVRQELERETPTFRPRFLQDILVIEVDFNHVDAAGLQKGSLVHASSPRVPETGERVFLHDAEGNRCWATVHERLGELTMRFELDLSTWVSGESVVTSGLPEPLVRESFREQVRAEYRQELLSDEANARAVEAWVIADCDYVNKSEFTGEDLVEAVIRAALGLSEDEV